MLSFIMSMVPLRRMATPAEITGICSYLANDDSAFMTGSALLIDGESAVVDVSGATLTNAGDACIGLQGDDVVALVKRAVEVLRSIDANACDFHPVSFVVGYGDIVVRFFVRGIRRDA